MKTRKSFQTDNTTDKEKTKTLGESHIVSMNKIIDDQDLSGVQIIDKHPIEAINIESDEIKIPETILQKEAEVIKKPRSGRCLEILYVIDEILERRIKNGKSEVLVSWKGFSKFCNRWIEEESMVQMERSSSNKESKISMKSPIPNIKSRIKKKKNNKLFNEVKIENSDPEEIKESEGIEEKEKSKTKEKEKEKEKLKAKEREKEKEKEKDRVVQEQAKSREERKTRRRNILNINDEINIDSSIENLSSANLQKEEHFEESRNFNDKKAIIGNKEQENRLTKTPESLIKVSISEPIDENWDEEELKIVTMFYSDQKPTHPSTTNAIHQKGKSQEMSENEQPFLENSYESKCIELD